MTMQSVSKIFIYIRHAEIPYSLQEYLFVFQ